jgi:hypothetical protein
VAKLVLRDFMLVHGNDWFAIPLDQPLGTLSRIDSRGGEAPVTTSGGTGPPAPFRYLIQTPVPENWIPFLPVLDENAPGKCWLERTFMQRGAAPESLVLPIGRILRPTNLASGQPYQVFEEEVPRERTRVTRHVVRSRWVDGSTHLWVARRKSVGVGEGSSGLRFDLAVPSGRSKSTNSSM